MTMTEPHDVDYEYDDVDDTGVDVDEYVPPRSERTGRELPYRPNGVKQPMDRKRSAAQREAEGPAMAVFEYRGIEFTFPAATDDWPVDATFAFESNLTTRGLRLLVGAEQFAAFLKLKPTNRDTREAVLGIQRTVGIEGN